MPYPTIEELKANPLVAILTGHTCGEACWHAKEEVCRCSCGGQNHGILKRGGARPDRTSRIGGNFYTLVAIVPNYLEADKAISDIIDERFPGLDPYGYGDYRQEKIFPVLSRKVSASQAKWPEVKAVAFEGRFDNRRLIWSRPAGTPYLIREKGGHKSIYA